jgi:peptidoglycan/LPS O-acetylase OafA/YrhL
VTLGIFLAIEVYHETHKNQQFPEAFYASVHRISWACLVSWIIFTCHHLKSGGFINWILSQPLWQPIARISLSIYLVHDIYIVMSVANQKERWYFESSWLIHIIIGDITISSMLGAFLYLIIEAPSNLVLRYFMK